MKEYRIETEPLQFLAIYDMRINMGTNRHGTAKISGYIADEWEEKYMAMLMQEIWISIVAVDEEESRQVVFCGLVHRFQIGKEKSQKSLELELVSGTYLMDLQQHIRLFQDRTVSYGEIIRQLTSSNNGKSIIYDSLDMAIGELIVQFEESDWAFLMRLLSGCQSFLVPETREKGINYTAGFGEGRELHMDAMHNYAIEKDIQEYWEKKNHGIEMEMIDGYICHIEDRELFYLGDYVIWRGVKMYIAQIERRYVNGEMINHYQAMTRNALKTMKYYQEKIKGNSMAGEVTDVKADKVRIRLREDENAGKCTEKWFPFSTPYSAIDGTGWYFMPEAGDTIRLYFPDKIEENAYAISAVHMGNGAGERSRPEHKILKNKQQKEIRFTPDSILMTNNKGMRIEMIDEEGIWIESDKDIYIGSKADMNIISQHGSLILAADSALELSQGETSIQLEDGIQFMGGEFHVQ